MAKRLCILFRGSPEEGAQSFIEVVGRDYQPVIAPRFVKWRLADKKIGTWSLDLDVVPLNRSKVIYLLIPENAQNEDVEACRKELTGMNNLLLTVSADHLEREQRIALKRECVEICDRVFVVNASKTDAETDSLVEYANEIGTRVAFLNYGGNDD